MSQITEIKIPDIGESSEVEVVEILVAVGDQVTKEDPLLTLESDKASMEIPTPSDGTINEIKVSIGDKVSEGSLVVLLEASSQETADTAVTEPEASPAAPEIPEPPTQEAPPAPEPTPVNTPPPSLPAMVDDSSKSSPHASPGIRRYARELGADLNKVAGSGAKGRISKDDVKTWIKQQLSGPAKSEGSGIPSIPAVDFSKFGEVENLALGRIQKLSGPHLQRAWLNIPHVTQHDEADITELEAFRKSLKAEAEKEGIRVTLLAFVLKILEGGLRKFPMLNASLDPGGESVILKKYFNIGIAVDTPNGLVVPVIRDVDKKSIFELALEMGELGGKARDGKLSPSDLQGGCISISSLGGIGGTAFTPIVNAPEVAILGIARSRMAPVWDGKEFQPRLMLPLSLSYDHRVIDGAQGARFCAYLVQMLGDCRRLVL